jgi:DNA-binding response OmpR family regulator
MAKKILIVEDDPLITKIYTTRLTTDGYEVKNAENGELGIIVAKEFSPDLIILDVMMPKMDGFGCLESLRKIPEFMSIPILMYSNLAAEEEQVRAKELGVTEFLVKANISPTMLIKKIAQYLQGVIDQPENVAISDNASPQAVATDTQIDSAPNQPSESNTSDPSAENKAS